MADHPVFDCHAARHTSLGFFESAWLDDRVRVVDLSSDVVEGNAAAVLESVDRELASREVSFIAVDLVRALTPTSLLNDLAFHLARCAATSLLIDCDPLDQDARQSTPR